MKRVTLSERPDQCEDAYYQFTLAKIETLEKASNELMTKFRTLRHT